MREIDKKLINAVLENDLDNVKRVIAEGTDVNLEISFDKFKKFVKDIMNFNDFFIVYNMKNIDIKYVSIIDVCLVLDLYYSDKISLLYNNICCIDNIYIDSYLEETEEDKKEKERLSKEIEKYKLKSKKTKEIIEFILNNNFNIKKFSYLIQALIIFDEKLLYPVFNQIDKVDILFAISKMSFKTKNKKFILDLIKNNKCDLYKKDCYGNNIIFYLIAFLPDLEILEYLAKIDKNLFKEKVKNEINPLLYSFITDEKDIFDFIKGLYDEDELINLSKQISYLICSELEDNNKIKFEFNDSIFGDLDWIIKEYTEKNIIKRAKIYHSDLDLNMKCNDKSLFELFFEKKDKEMMKYLIQNGVDINTKLQNGKTPLAQAIQNWNMDMVKFLIENGANVNIIYNKLSIIEYAEFLGNEELINLIKSSPTYKPLEINNKADKLVNILKNFSKNSPIKYTTHDWSKDIQEEYGDFDCFMTQVKNDWKKIEKDLKALSPNLHKKISLFLFAENQNEHWYKEENDTLSIGWSNLDGLKEWCNMGKNPFEFELKEPIIINKKRISTFGGVIKIIFKNEIEIRDNNLKKIFQNFRNILKRKEKFKVDLSELKGDNNFYTDVEKLKIALDRIAKIIYQKYESQNKQNQHIKIKFIDFKDYSEIEIIHINSFSYLNPDIMLEKIKKGDFAELEKNLKNICDFSIKNKDSNKNSYRVNYLISKSTTKIEKINEEIEGFTYILRFYK